MKKVVFVLFMFGVFTGLSGGLGWSLGHNAAVKQNREELAKIVTGEFRGTLPTTLGTFEVIVRKADVDKVVVDSSVHRVSTNASGMVTHHIVESGISTPREVSPPDWMKNSK